MASDRTRRRLLVHRSGAWATGPRESELVLLGSCGASTKTGGAVFPPDARRWGESTSKHPREWAEILPKWRKGRWLGPVLAPAGGHCLLPVVTCTSQRWPTAPTARLGLPAATCSSSPCDLSPHSPRSVRMASRVCASKKEANPVTSPPVRLIR